MTCALLTPSLPQPVTFWGWKVRPYTPPNCILDGPRINLLSLLSILVEIFSHAHGKEQKGLNGFKFGTFIGRFQSDSVASKAVKRLKTCQPAQCTDFVLSYYNTPPPPPLWETICLTVSDTPTPQPYFKFDGECLPTQPVLFDRVGYFWRDNPHAWKSSGLPPVSPPPLPLAGTARPSPCPSRWKLHSTPRQPSCPGRSPSKRRRRGTSRPWPASWTPLGSGDQPGMASCCGPHPPGPASCWENRPRWCPPWSCRRQRWAGGWRGRGWRPGCCPACPQQARRWGAGGGWGDEHVWWQKPPGRLSTSPCCHHHHHCCPQSHSAACVWSRRATTEAGWCWPGEVSWLSSPLPRGRKPRAVKMSTSPHRGTRPGSPGATQNRQQTQRQERACWVPRRHWHPSRGGRMGGVTVQRCSPTCDSGPTQ